MRAIVLEKFGGPDSLVYTDLPEPEPMPGHVVIEIKAFGLNHAEMHMRRGEWAEAAKVIGIECVGLVKSCPGGEFSIGAKVAALMGGLAPIKDFNPLLQMASGVYLTFFGSCLASAIRWESSGPSVSTRSAPSCSSRATRSRPRVVAMTRTPASTAMLSAAWPKEDAAPRMTSVCPSAISRLRNRQVQAVA